jgi:AraC-like DNA-binding protein
MQGGASSRFTDPGEYRASLRDLEAELVVTGRGRFDARLTEALLPHLTMMCAEESVARVAYLSLPETRVHVSIPTGPERGFVHNGMLLQPGDMVFHAPGERAHQRVLGASRWRLLSLAPRFVAVYAGALMGRRFASLPSGCTVRPRSEDRRQLDSLLGRIVSLIQTQPLMIAHPEVARTLEQDIIQALVQCIESGETLHVPAICRRYAQILTELEGVLARDRGRRIPVHELCQTIGADERTLRVGCARLLGVSPSRYMRLRRLGLVRTALSNADPTTDRAGEIARRHGFIAAGRFAASYRFAFGETPSATLRCAENSGGTAETSKSA